ncbi:MAG TPA: trypsin-like peptidase domain-containing protein [Blastocatellia bacterium]|nr:trypsin-like peptidase domain-containing protein [Blastocatellia bacterium]
MRATFTHLTGSRKGESDKLEAEVITIGRAPDNLLAFGDHERRVSSHHAEIRRDGSRFILRDLGSTNGTMINGRRVKASELHADELIEFGSGGPLVRFGIEYDDAQVAADGRKQEITKSGPPGNSTLELMVDRALQNRSNNLWLLVALVAAMVLGAVGGIALSWRRGTDFIEVARQNSAAVVFIRAEYTLFDSSGQPVINDARTGTGFVISSSGLIVTNRHLVREWEYNPTFAGANGQITKIEIIFPGNRRDQAVPAQIHKLSATTETDVAILKIDPSETLPVIRRVEPSTEAIRQGEGVAVIGYPLGLDLLRLTGENMIAPSLMVGVVSRVNPGMIQLSLRAYNGNSGGPVFDGQGRVIGILTANVSSAEDLTLCTPIEAALELIKDGRAGVRGRGSGIDYQYIDGYSRQ